MSLYSAVLFIHVMSAIGLFVGLTYASEQSHG